MIRRGELVPLVCAVGDGFALSQEFLDVVGPIWGRSWKAKAFVAHIVSHFEDPLEHLLDYCPNGNESAFDVDPEWCEIIARKYKEEFLDLPEEWYRSMFRAKLESLRIPAKLIEEAKWAYLRKYHDHKVVVQGFLDMSRRRSYRIPDALLPTIRSLPNLPVLEAWAGLERVLNELLDSGVITTVNISELLMENE